MNFEKISPLNDHDEIKKARKEKKLAEKKSTEDKVKKDDETNKLTRRKLIKIGLGAFVGSLIPEGIERLKNNEKNLPTIEDDKNQKSEEELEPTSEQIKIENENLKALVEALHREARENFEEKQSLPQRDPADNKMAREDEKQDEIQPTIADVFSFEAETDIDWDAEKLVENLDQIWLEKYSKGGKKWQELVEGYLKMQQKIYELKNPFVKKGLSGNLAYVAIPESGGFNEKSVSPANARGAYQFIESTARLYGLVYEKNGKTIDNRFDPIKSAEACAKFFEELSGKINDRELMACGYNGGFIYEYIRKTPNKDERTRVSFIDYMINKTNKIRKELREEPYYTYTVGNNEILSKISSKFYIKNYLKLAEYNNISDPDNIQPGEEIKIPLENFEHRKKIFERIARTKGLTENFNYASKIKAVLDIIESGELDGIQLAEVSTIKLRKKKKV